MPHRHIRPRSLDPGGRHVATLAGDVADPATGRAAVALAEARFGGVDILISNAGIFVPKPFLEHEESDFDAYVGTIAKAGVHQLVRNLAIELAADNIRVNAVAPAVVETPVYEAFLQKDQIPGGLAGFAPMHPLGRHGQPQDVVVPMLLLASDAAGWITGTVLPVDGGVMAGRS